MNIPIQFYRYQLLFIITLTFITSCKQNQPKNIINEEITGTLVTAKYSYTYYPKEKKEGVNIYYAGWIINNTPDTIFIVDKDMSRSGEFQFKESFFYTMINGDSLFFAKWFTSNVIFPKDSTRICLQRHIMPLEKKFIQYFNNIKENQIILDTLIIHYATPNNFDSFEILPPITFKKSTKFRIDTAHYNSYIDGIFDISDYYGKPVTLLEEE